MLTENQTTDTSQQIDYEWKPNLTEMELQPTSYEIWQQKYQLKNEKQEPIDLTVNDTFKRVAEALSRSEPEWYEKFLWTLHMGATPAGRIMSNAGAEAHKPNVSTINCTVSQIVKDSMKGILEANLDAGLTLAAGCGIGYEFSTLRPRGAFVSGAGAYTSGSLSFMDIFDSMCFTVASAGGRRGAQMATFAVWHPDVEAFIVAKREDGRFRQFNCSLLIDDEFMEAVKNDSDWDLRFPVRPKELEKGIVKKSETVWKPIPWERAYCEEMSYILDNDMMLFKVYKTIKAKELWDTIMKSTYDFAEPGFILIDRYNEMNNNYFCENIRATNPCLTGDTLVATENGYVRLDSVKVGDSIQTVDGLHPVTSIETSYDVRVYEVELSDGTILKATGAHIFHVARKKFFDSNTRLDQLSVGDSIRLAPASLVNETNLPTPENVSQREFGLLIGAMIGDGSYTENSKSVKFVAGKHEQKWLNLLFEVAAKAGTPQALSKTNDSCIQFCSTPLMHFFDKETDLIRAKGPKKSLPLSMLNSNKEFLAGYIDGHISTDGNINMNKSNPMVRVASSSKESLMMLKRALSFFGILARVYRETGKKKGMTTKISGRNITRTSDGYVLVVLGDSIKKLNDVITITNPDKRDRLRDLVVNYNLTGCTWKAVIKRITPLEKETVYDLFEESTDTWITDGVVNRGCGEQGLPPEGSCLLGSINLAKFVLFPFTDHAKFDFITYEEVVRVFSRMLDNVVEINGLPLPGQRREIESKRRHGMGFLGLGTTLSLLGMEYGSKESVDFTEEVAKVMAVEGYRAGVDLAEEKGPAPLLNDMENRKAWTKSKFMKRIWKAAPELKERALEHGCRYTHATSIAPTGTISLSVNNNVSNGIEPSFSHKYTRNVIKEGKKSKEAVDVYSYEMLLWKHLTGNDDVPEFFSTSDNIKPKAHVDIQAAAQKWCDSSISKTINVPTDTPFEEFKDIYTYAYSKGLKGCTTFRYNPVAFQGVLVTEDNLKKTIYRFTTDEGEVIEVAGNEKIMYDGEEHSAANLYDALKENYFGKF